MGDALTEGVVDVAKTCSDPRPAGAVGNCYEFTYTPLADPGAQKWAGVYWQYPQNNWATSPARPSRRARARSPSTPRGARGAKSSSSLPVGYFDVSKTYHDTMKVDQRGNPDDGDDRLHARLHGAVRGIGPRRFRFGRRGTVRRRRSATVRPRRGTGERSTAHTGRVLARWHPVAMIRRAARPHR